MIEIKIDIKYSLSITDKKYKELKVLGQARVSKCLRKSNLHWSIKIADFYFRQSKEILMVYEILPSFGLLKEVF